MAKEDVKASLSPGHLSTLLLESPYEHTRRAPKKHSHETSNQQPPATLALARHHQKPGVTPCQTIAPHPNSPTLTLPPCGGHSRAIYAPRCCYLARSSQHNSAAT